MAYIDWNDGCCLGFHLIDEEHRRLVDLINRLYAANGAQDDQALSAVFKGLVDYTQTHFAVEEEIMLAYAYPDYKDHKALHDEFKARIAQLQSAMGNSAIDIPESLMKYLRNWLLKHILGIDRSLVEFLKGKVFVR